MKQISAILWCLALIVPALPSAHAKPQEVEAKPRSLVLTHVTVIDATGAAAQPDMTVVVAGDRISALGKTSQLRPPAEAQIVDARGKFLVPGLLDMHTHLDNKEYLPLYLANGVTGVRFMDGNPSYHEWRREVESGAMLGPRMVIASKFVDGPHPVHPAASIAVSNEAQGRQAVIQSKREGADFIKIYSLVPHAAYFAIADQAKREGIPFAGHVPREVTATEASDAGQKSIEHLSGLPFICSKRAPEYGADLAKLKAELAAVGAPGNYYRLLRHMEGQYLAAYEPQKCAPLFARFIRNRTWQVPTLDVVQSGAQLADPAFVEPQRKYLPPQTREEDPRKSPAYRSFTPADYDNLKEMLARQLQIVGEMQRAGVRIMAGTDISPVGFPLHGELALLVQAGLTPMEALQSATLSPALYFGTEKELGTIEVGKVADLLLLDANPLSDIHNTQKIDTVIVRGRLLDRAQLDRMLAAVAAAGTVRP